MSITEYIWLNTSEILVDSRFRARSGSNLVYLLRKNERKWRNKVKNQWFRNHGQSPPNSFLTLSHYPSSSRQVTNVGFFMVRSLIFILRTVPYNKLPVNLVSWFLLSSFLFSIYFTLLLRYDTFPVNREKKKKKKSYAFFFFFF